MKTTVFVTENEHRIHKEVEKANTRKYADHPVNKDSQDEAFDEAGWSHRVVVDNLHLKKKLADRLTVIDQQVEIDDEKDDQADEHDTRANECQGRWLLFG